MDFAKKMLSRLFHHGDEREDVASTETNTQQSKTSQAAMVENVPSPTEIALPDDHVLYKLWDLWRDGVDVGPPPKLDFAPEDPKVELPVTNLSHEKGVLRQDLAFQAGLRLRHAVVHPDDQPAPVLDEMVLIHLSADQLAAWILLLPPIGGGRQLTAAQIKQALVQKGVTFGVDEQLLARLPSHPQKYFHLFFIAHGIPAIQGKDGMISDRFPRTVERTIQVDEFNRVDYTSLNFVHNVAEGDVICDISDPIPGKPGMSVLGQTIPARDGVPATPPKGRNTELSEDGRHLIATRAGHVEFSGRTFQVKPVLDIAQNVDYSTGNINFLGDVYIHGDVCSGFTVRAIGNIHVEGVVEACTIEAGGDLTVVGGIQGQGNAHISAHKNIYTKFIEHARVYARESVQADCVIISDVYSDGCLSVRTGRGTIIGGDIRVSKEVQALTIGSKSEAMTAITLGGLPCEDFERGQILSELREIEYTMEKLEPQPDSPAKSSKLAKLRLDMYVAKMKLEKFDKDFAALMPETPENDERRLICESLYPGTVIGIDGESIRIHEVTHHCTVRMVDGELKCIY